MSESPQTLFDALAEDYESMREEVGWNPFVHIREVFENSDLSGKAILDAGCGTGECTRWFQSRGASPYGLDISPEMCFKAAENSENIPYLCHDLGEPLPFEDDRFDGAVALGCLEYIPNIEETVREFARILKPNGAFLGCFERCGKDCPGGNALSVVMFDDWVRFRLPENEIRAMILRHFAHAEFKRVPGFKLTDDDGKETGKQTQYLRVIAVV